MPSSTSSSSKTKARAPRRMSKRSARQRHAHGGGKATSKRAQGGSGRWSAHVMATSDALDLQHDIFKTGKPQEIAASLKSSALKSRRRKGSPLQSAMSMLNFYINRAGRNLPAARKRALQEAKGALREAFGRDASGKPAKRRAAKAA